MFPNVLINFIWNTNQVTPLWHVDDKNNTWPPYNKTSKRQLKPDMDYYIWLIHNNICRVLMYLELSRYNEYFVQESTSYRLFRVSVPENTLC